MRLDAAQFQDMWKAGPGNNCWTTSEQVWMKKLLSSNGTLVLNLVLEFCMYKYTTSSCVSSTHPAFQHHCYLYHHHHQFRSMAITTTYGSSTCTPATTSRSTTHPSCYLAPPSRAHWQPQHGCLREPPAPPTAQVRAHASYNIYHQPHRVCLYSLATSYPIVSRNDLCS